MQWACYKKASAYGSTVGWTPARRIQYDTMLKAGDGVYLWNEELDSERFLAAPQSQFHHESFDTLEDKLGTLQTPLQRHVLATTHQLQGAQSDARNGASYTVCNNNKQLNTFIS